MMQVFNSNEIIDPDNVSDDVIHISDIDCEMFPDKKIKLYRKSEHIIFWVSFPSLLKKGMRYTQEEFPISALEWIIEGLTSGGNNKPLKVPSEPGDNTIVATFSGEEIGLSPMMHCCAENVPGYRLWNKSRTDHLTGLSPQSFEIPRYLILDQMIPALERCRWNQ